MTSLFYYIGFLLFVLYIPMLISYVKTMKLRYIYKIRVDEKKTEIINKNDRPVYMKFLTSGLSVFISWTWLIIGLLSNNWLIFLSIIIVYSVLSKIITSIGDKNKMNYVRTYLYMLLYSTLALSMLFISLNHFFFKYDLALELKTLLGVL